MKVAVFGTGYIYEVYKGRILADVCCLVDNSLKKQGMLLDGKKVIGPTELVNYEFSYIVIMTLAHNEIRRQLIELGVPDKKILDYTQIDALAAIYPMVHATNEILELKQWFVQNSGKKKILLVSHDFSYTGVPVLLMNLAMVLKESNCAVLMTGLEEGNLSKELQENKIDYLERIGTCYGTQWFSESVEKFDHIVVGTLTLYQFVKKHSETANHILWWVHESAPYFYEAVELPENMHNIQVFGGGNRAVKAFKKYFPEISIQKLNYCIPDAADKHEKAANEKLKLGIVGTLCERKAQDVVMRAIQLLPLQYRNTFECYVVGKESSSEPEYCQCLKNEMNHLEEVQFLGELNQDQIEDFYQSIDVLLCPSRDDPMPLVVTQAMLYKKTCVISEDVGQSEYIKQGVNGFVFKNEDAEELAYCLVRIIEDKECLNQIGEAARQIYQDEFSVEVMKKNLALHKII